MTSIAYVDASALVKLMVPDAESAEMHRWYVEADRVITSRVGVIEARRAAARYATEPVHVGALMRSVEIFEVDAAVAARAATVGPSLLRTLDAIHLATALTFGAELDAFVTYDDRLAAAAREIGLPVVRPA